MNTQAGGDPSGSPPSWFLGQADSGFLPHIEGLRAIAVLSVLLFHVDFAWAPGGYIGVDVFFVISGYLITRLIVRDMAEGRFSLMGFYQRRMARLFPALAVLILASLLVFPWVMHPSEIVRLGWQAGTAALFAANIYFSVVMSYFNPAAQTTPLLHLWTLGVEEQFYLAFPLLLMAVQRWRNGRFGQWIGFAVLASLLALVVGGQSYGSLFFYMLPLRGWELGVGALVALYPVPLMRSPRLESALALAGVAFIVGTVVMANARNTLPHLSAVPPTLGTALLIAYGHRSILRPLLSNTLMQWIGRISYSVYLWHWPIVVMVWLTGFALTSLFDQTLVVMASLCAGAASYRWVEKPALQRLHLMAPARVLAGTGAVMVSLLMLSMILISQAGRFRTYSPTEQQDLRYLADNVWASTEAHWTYGACPSIGQRDIALASCTRHLPGARNILLFGDSTAGMLAPALQAKIPDANLVRVTNPGCRPLRRWTGINPCATKKSFVFEQLALSGKVSEVLLSANWQRGDEVDLAEVIRLFQAHHIRVTLIGPGMAYRTSLPRLLLLNDSQAPIRQQIRDTPDVDRALAELAGSLGVRYISPYQLNCPKGFCKVRARNGAPMLNDSVHLTSAGATELVAQFPPF